MLRILQVIAGNAASAPATVRLPDHVPAPARFRGRVLLEPARCVACGTCAYVCVSNAITGAELGAAYGWTYEPGRCAFCARCVDHCVGGALSMEEAAAPVYTRPGELRVEVRVPFPACVSCGAPTRPVTEALLRRAYAQVGGEARELARRCERCRRREVQRALGAGAGLAPAREGEGER